MTLEEEEKMLEEAFEKGIVRIPTNELLNWYKAKEISEELADGLCTAEDFERCNLKYPESFDHIAYAIKNDGSIEAIQLGSDPRAGELTWSSVTDRHRNQQEYCKLQNQHKYKQLDYIFAKRCTKKNPVYIPIDITYENKL